MQQLLQRFNHPHYHLNNVLSVSLPLLLFRQFDLTPTNVATISICLWSPLFHGLFSALGDKGIKAPLGEFLLSPFLFPHFLSQTEPLFLILCKESLHASYTFNLRRYSLFSLVYASWSKKLENGWYWVGVYSLAWLGTRTSLLLHPPESRTDVAIIE